MHENNYFLWNQQVEGVIHAQRVHKVVVNPHISINFKMTQDQVKGNVTNECEEWNVQDQTIFIWLLLTISEFVLPRVLSNKHAYEVWDNIHIYFNAHMNDRVRHLRVELNSLREVPISSLNLCYMLKLLQICCLPLEIWFRNKIRLNLFSMVFLRSSILFHANVWNSRASISL